VNKGCCNATATAALSALTDRISAESSRPHSPDFLRGLQVAEAVDFLRIKIGVTNFGLIAGIAEGERGYDEWATVEQYASDKPDELLSALVNGYEIENSPEDKVREYYERLRTYSRDGNGPYEAQMYSIESTLNFLGIKIEGVNAE
jgi:hypothetical protein